VKHLKLPLILLLLIAIAVASGLWLGRSKPVDVALAAVTDGVVQDTVANTRAGTIKACRRAGISPSVGGQIDRLPVTEGDQVEAGQVLMELWNDDQMAQLELATSKAKAAEATARQACIKAEVSRREARRLQQLKQKKLTSEEAVDKADGEARAQQAACEAALATNLVNQAQIHVAEAALDRTRLTAPFAGIVAEVNGEIGEFVTPSPVGIPTPPAVDLVDVSCLYVSAPMDEVDAPQIRVGMPANISLDAMAGQLFDGKVRRVAPYVLEMEKQARTVDVEVDFLCAEDCRNMLPGYSADIEVILNESSQTLRIPTEALLEGNRVLVMTADGLLAEREIGIGLSNWAWTEVLTGLDAGEEVVTSVEREGVADGVSAVREPQAGDDD
jgi:HlyD family secretion protein